MIATPKEEAENLIALADAPYSVDFSSTDNHVVIWIDDNARISPEVRKRALRLAPEILQQDFGDWQESPGISGRIIISKEGMFLDGDDLREDWSFEHDFDPEDLEGAEWSVPDAPAPG